MIKKLGSPSLLMYFFLLLLIVLVYVFSYVGVSINYDVFGYYTYLPITFIHHDISFSNPQTYSSVLDNYNQIHEAAATGIYTVFPVEGGNFVIKYTSGWAVCYLPFFFLGHLCAIIGGYATDGFSVPYHSAILAGAMFYTLLGVYYLRKLLLLFYSETTTAIMLFVTVFGTNYFIHTAFHIAGAMTHNHLFALVTAAIYYTHLWYKKPSVNLSLLLGIIFGLIALTRVTELTVGVLFLLWGSVNKDQSFLSELKKNKKYLFTLFGTALLILTIQLIYWKLVTGKFIYNSYNIDAWEGFDFDNPHIMELLFSFRKGWVLYTPLTIFIFFGLYKMARNKFELFWPLFIYTVLHLFVVASWSNWWYADSYSCRALIPYLSVFALCGAYAYEFVFLKQYGKTQRIVFAAIFLLLFTYSEFKIWQSSRGIIHTRLMSKEFYFKSFFLLKRNMDLEDKYLLFDRFKYNGKAIPNISELVLKNDFAKIDFETEKSIITHSGKGALEVNNTIEYTPSLKVKRIDITDKYYAWVRVKIYIYLKDSITLQNTPMLSCFSEHKGDVYNYQGRRFSEMNLKPGMWNEVQYDYLTIEPRSEKDDLVFYVWNPSKINFIIDDFSFDVYEPSKND